MIVVNTLEVWECSEDRKLPIAARLVDERRGNLIEFHPQALSLRARPKLLPEFASRPWKTRNPEGPSQVGSCDRFYERPPKIKSKAVPPRANRVSRDGRSRAMLT